MNLSSQLRTIPFNEEFLHFVWKYKNFVTNNLYTSDGSPVKLVKTGEHNTNAGPDFLNAQIMIDDTHWAGNIEIHLKTSDWIAHNHDQDPAYDNIILHVVYEHDLERIVPANRPLLVIANHISANTIKNYEELKKQHHSIPCENLINRVDPFIKSNWLDRMLTERLETKSNYINLLLKQNNNDWAETAYQLTGRNFGFKVNGDAFERLTRAIPHKILAKHKNNIHQIDALLFGQAGFLQDVFNDKYPQELQKEYRFLAGKYNLNPGRKADWKFLRLRPGNFPTLRISQFGALIYKSEHLFSKILEVEDIKTALSFFEVQAHDYWKHHYTFGTTSSKTASGDLGKESKYNLIINTVAPILFSYGHIKNEPEYKETAIKLLENCPKELNTISRSAMKIGFPNEHACHSQGLIHLRYEFCNKQQCLACGIGVSVLKG